MNTIEYAKKFLKVRIAEEEVKERNWKYEMEGCLFHVEEGEKYKKIVEEMDEVLEPGMIFEIPEGMVGSRHIDVIKYLFKEIKEKYFPKPVKKTITIEFESKSEDLINRTIKHLKSGSIESWYNGLVKVNIKEE